MNAYQLTDLDIDEVSLVDKAANGARFLLYKNEQGAPPPAEAPPAPPAPEPETVAKSWLAGLSPEARADLAKQLDPTVAQQLAKAAEDIAKAQEQIAALVRKDKLTGYAAIAKAEGFAHRSPEEHAERLLKFEESYGAEFVAKELEDLRAQAAALKTSALLAEFGKSGAQSGAGTAEAEVMAKAEAMVAKGEAKDKASAISAIMKSDRALAARYQAEGRAR